jgi:hypothetical protein
LVIVIIKKIPGKPVHTSVRISTDNKYLTQLCLFLIKKPTPENIRHAKITKKILMENLSIFGKSRKFTVAKPAVANIKFDDFRKFMCWVVSIILRGQYLLLTTFSKSHP